MKAMLWKELRENFKWAMMAMVGLGLAEIYGLYYTDPNNYNNRGITLCNPTFLMATSLGNAVVGLLLGLVQILPEQRRDQWAALLHRPVPRATIYRGKAVAGLLLYLGATIVPFVACVVYASRPGHFAAPFTPRMIFPGVADICAGAMYYFAALFVSLQRGAWWGTRAFGVLAALSGSFVVTSNYLPFYVVIETAAAMSLALFTAAWGAMLTNGTFAARPWLGRVAALAIVFYGVCAAGAVVGLVWNAFQKPDYYFGSEYILDLDGRPLVQTTSRDGGRQFKDLDGKPVDDPRLSGGLAYRNMIEMSAVSSYVGNPHDLPVTQQIPWGYRASENYCMTLQVFTQVNNEAWYYLNHERLFEGFNSMSRAPVGSIGQDGFAPGLARAQPFREKLGASTNFQMNTAMRFGDTVYFLDVGERTARPILTAPGISGVANLSSYGDDPTLRNLAAVALPDRLDVVDKTGTIVAALPYQHDMEQWGALIIGAKSAQGPLFLESTPSEWISWEKRRTMPSYLEQFDLQGHVVKSFTLPPLPVPHFPRTWTQWVTESLGTPAFFYGSMVYQKAGALLGSKRLAREIHERFHEGWGYTRDVGTRTTALSFLLAVVALFWARRSEFTWKESWKWAAFVLAFNLAGLITFRLVADWPVRIACPSCQRKRRIDMPTCGPCGAAWPSPARDGTEIVDEPIAAA